MMPSESQSCRGKAIAVLGVLVASVAACQVQTRSPVDLIRDLTYQSERRETRPSRVVFTCGSALREERENRALAKALAGLGVSAVPAIEEALGSLEARGAESGIMEEATWVMLAYARIKGAGAYPRLHKMVGRPNLVPHAIAWMNPSR